MSRVGTAIPAIGWWVEHHDKPAGYDRTSLAHYIAELREWEADYARLTAEDPDEVRRVFGADAALVATCLRALLRRFKGLEGWNLSPGGVDEWPASETVVQRQPEPAGGPARLPGENLTMADGSVWFHPYSGGAPVCLMPPRKKAP